MLPLFTDKLYIFLPYVSLAALGEKKTNYSNAERYERMKWYVFSTSYTAESAHAESSVSLNCRVFPLSALFCFATELQRVIYFHSDVAKAAISFPPFVSCIP